MTVEAFPELYDLHVLIAKTIFRNRVTNKHYIRI